MLDDTVQQATLDLTTATPRLTLLWFRLLFLVISDLLGALGTQKAPVGPRLAVGRHRKALPTQLAVIQLARQRPWSLRHHLSCQGIVVVVWICVCVWVLLETSGFASCEVFALFDAVQGGCFFAFAFLSLLGGFARCCFFCCLCLCLCCFLFGFLLGFLLGFLDSSLVVFVDLPS